MLRSLLTAMVVLSVASGAYGQEPPEGMVLIPAGEFEMGDSFGEGESNELPVRTVNVDSFYMDVYEVTNTQYSAALNWAISQKPAPLVAVLGGLVIDATTGTVYCDTTVSSSYSRITWDAKASTFSVTSGKEDHPMVNVNWYGAAAYCNWRSRQDGRTPCYSLSTWECEFEANGYRLPTEAEWEKAAGWDPSQDRHFRFGEHSDGCGFSCLEGPRANYDLSGDPYDTLGAEPYTTPVGFYNGELHFKVDFDWPGGEASYQTQDAQSYYGCRDMSGNVWEWCHDWQGEYLPCEPAPCDNPHGPANGAERVLRGGSWYDPPHLCRSTWRGDGGASARYRNSGLRCVAGAGGPSIPAVSNIGLAVMTLLVMSAGGWIVMKRMA